MDARSEHLRELAEWHRKYAELAGNDDERQSRLRLANYLDRRATELDRRATTQP